MASDWSMFCSYSDDPMSRYCGSKFYWILCCNTSL